MQQMEVVQEPAIAAAVAASLSEPAQEIELHHLVVPF